MLPIPRDSHGSNVMWSEWEMTHIVMSLITWYSTIRDFHQNHLTSFHWKRMVAYMGFTHGLVCFFVCLYCYFMAFKGA